MINFFNEKLKYYSGYESFCYQNSLRLILESYGIEYAPLYINAALSLNVDIDNNLTIKFFFAQHSRSFLPEYASKDNRIYYPLNVNPLEVFKENMEMVNNNKTAIIVGTDLFYLPYLDYYHKRHGSHTLILCGSDIDNNMVDIVDWYEPWFYKGKMDKSEFILSRNSLNPKDSHFYSGNPIRNNWTEISRNGWETQPEHLIRTVLQLSNQQFFETDNNGHLCFKKIIKILEDFANDNGTHKEIMKTIHMGFFQVSKRFKFFKQYLEIAQRYNCKSEVIVISLEEYICIFENLLMLLYKMTMIDSTNTLERAIEKLRMLDKMHDRIYANITEIEKSMR